MNTSKDTLTTKVEDFLTVSNKDSSGNGKDSSGKDTSAHGNESAANGEDSAADAKDSGANAKDSADAKDSSNEKSSSTNTTDTTVQVEVTEESKTGQELASEVGEDSRQVEQHDSGNASSAGESEMKAEPVTIVRKELEPTCEDNQRTREEEMEVEVSNVVEESVSAQSEEGEKQPAATTPGTPPPLPDGDDL